VKQHVSKDVFVVCFLNCRSAVDSLVTATLVTGPLGAMKTNLDTFIATQVLKLAAAHAMFHGNHLKGYQLL